MFQNWNSSYNSMSNSIKFDDGFTVIQDGTITTDTVNCNTASISNDLAALGSTTNNNSSVGGSLAVGGSITTNGVVSYNVLTNQLTITGKIILNGVDITEKLMSL